MDTIGSRRHAALIKLIVEARLKAGMTQEELAERLSVYQSMIARIESGQRRLDVVEFMKIAETLSIDPAGAIRKLAKMERE